jgi:transcriptional regulator with XRE-family HTH domain
MVNKIKIRKQTDSLFILTRSLYIATKKIMTQNINLDKIGHSLRKIREIKGLKQETVAKKLGLTTNGYGKIERGESTINLERLNQIAEVFGVSANDILHFDENIIYNISNMNNSAPHGTVNNFSISEEERKVLQLQITTLTDIVEKQNQLIQQLLNKNK